MDFFEDALSQNGLGNPFLFLLGSRSFRTQLIAVGIILGGYWLAWALYPLPGIGFEYAAVGVSADWSHHARASRRIGTSISISDPPSIAEFSTSFRDPNHLSAMLGVFSS